MWTVQYPRNKPSHSQNFQLVHFHPVLIVLQLTWKRNRYNCTIWKISSVLSSLEGQWGISLDDAGLSLDQTGMRVDESRNSRPRLTANSHALSSTLNWFKCWWKMTRVFAHATLVLVCVEHESWENSHTNSRFSTLMPTLASQHSSTFM
jgi:hypothetical protein